MDLEYYPSEGDIVFQPLPDSDLTRAIEGATNSQYSHTGMVIKKHGLWYVREAVGPVKDTALFLWIMKGRDAKFAVYRLKEQYKQSIPSFINESKKYLGLPYDIYFELDDEKIYCSEMIYKSFKDATQESLGALKKLKELNWEGHREFIESIEVNGIPYEREMITPVDLSKASQLEKIYSNGI
ncbi:MAG: YiiX/YebB-like N1pC/P60 family cysteine hydrolase [Candidatus Thiodiazotropha sp.]